MNWLKLEFCALTAIVCWLSPAATKIPKLAQGIFLLTALPCAIATIPLSKKLILEEAIANAQEEGQKQIIQRQIATEIAQQLEQNSDLHPEVVEAQRQRLEAILAENCDESTSDLQTSDELAAAVRKLAEVGVSKTHIVEEILGYKGRSFNDGMQVLEKMLA